MGWDGIVPSLILSIELVRAASAEELELTRHSTIFMFIAKYRKTLIL
jgi:hypothetical protein